MQQHFWRKDSFQGVPKQVGKTQKFQGLLFFLGGGGGYDKHPHLLTTMPCLKRDEACWCTEAFISKRSTIFNCESVRLPNAWLWSIGKSFGWVQLFDYWTQLKSIEQIGVQLGSIDYTEMYSSMRFQLKKLENLWSYNGLFPTHQGQVIHKIFGNVTFKNLLVRWILNNIYTVVNFLSQVIFFPLFLVMVIYLLINSKQRKNKILAATWSSFA